jgi:hypothetical protein
MNTGYISFEKLDERLDRARRSPDKADVIAFGVHEDARDESRLVVVMYAVNGKEDLVSVKDAIETAPLGDRLMRVSIREAVELFGQNGEDAAEIIRNATEFYNRGVLTELEL